MKYRALVLSVLTGCGVADGAASEQPVSGRLTLTAPSTPGLAEVLRDELGRALETWQGHPAAPYYVALTVSASDSLTLETTWPGTLERTAHQSLWLAANPRVGSPALDSTHALPSGEFGPWLQPSERQLPLEAPALHPELVRHELWRSALSAARRLDHVLETTDDQAPGPADFALPEPHRDLSETPSMRVDADALAALVTTLDAVLRSDPEVDRASVRLRARSAGTLFIDSEGAHLEHGRAGLTLTLEVKAVRWDGHEIHLSHTTVGATPDALPDEDALVAEAERLVADLVTYKHAPSGAEGIGPVLLQGQAAARYIQTLFGQVAVASRTRVLDEFIAERGYLGLSALPTWLTVTDDPALTEHGGHPLAGAQRYDAEGQPSRPVVLFQDGVAMSLPTGLRPIGHETGTTGHTRRVGTHGSEQAISNLVLHTDQPLPPGQELAALDGPQVGSGRVGALVLDRAQADFWPPLAADMDRARVSELHGRIVHRDGRPDSPVCCLELQWGDGGLEHAWRALAAAGQDTWIVHDNSPGSLAPSSVVTPSLLLRAPSSISAERRADFTAPPPDRPAPQVQP